VNLLLKGLLDVVPPLTAEKILVSLYLLLFPLSVRFLCASVDPRQSYLSWLSFPFMMGFWFHTGFYNYCLGLTLYCFLLGSWLRMGPRTSPLRLLMFGALTIPLYFTHPVPSLMLVFSLVLLSAWFTIRDLTAAAGGRMTAKEVRRNAVTRWLETPLALLPFLLLLADFAGKILRRPARPITPPAAAGEAWEILYGFSYLTSFPGTETLVMRILFVLFLALLAAAAAIKFTRREIHAGDGFFLLFAALLSLYFRMTSWELMNKRLLVFIVLSAIVWLTTVPFGPRTARAVRTAAFVLAAVWAVNLTAQYRHWNRALEEGAGKRCGPDTRSCT
jgi:hypothetical protein